MKDDYEDLIQLPHYEPKHHPRMPLKDRAAQFAPFAALTGHAEAIEETARRIGTRMELGEETVWEADEEYMAYGVESGKKEKEPPK